MSGRTLSEVMADIHTVCRERTRAIAQTQTWQRRLAATETRLADLREELRKEHDREVVLAEDASVAWVELRVAVVDGTHRPGAEVERPERR